MAAAVHGSAMPFLNWYFAVIVSCCEPPNLDFSQQEMQWPKKRLTSLFVFELLIIWVDVISELLYLLPGDEIQPEAKRPETA